MSPPPQPKIKIVVADFDETQSTRASNPSLESACSSTMQASADLDALKNALSSSHRRLGLEACESIRKLSTCNDSSWTCWDSKPNFKIDKKPSDNKPGSIVGRVTIKWKPATPYTMEFMEEYIWNDKSKEEYDEYTEAVLEMLDYGDDFHVINQVFKGRFGISGRDFVVIAHKVREDTEEYEELIVGVQSISSEDVEIIVNTLMTQEAAAEYARLTKKVVRGFVYVSTNMALKHGDFSQTAGFAIQRDRVTGEFTLTYLYDADVKSRGVPQWIVNRVKLDQLCIVKAIPTCLAKKLAAT